MATLLFAAIVSVVGLLPDPPHPTAATPGPSDASARQEETTGHDQTRLEALVERSRDLPPLGFDLPRDAKMPPSLAFHDASSRDVLMTIARIGCISLIFDPSFRESPITINVGNAPLAQALETATRAAGAFFRATAPGIATVIADTPAKRQEYEDEDIVRTFYLSNADPKEALDLLRLVIDMRRIALSTANRALTVRDTPERVAAAARVLSALDKVQPEVAIDVELLDVDRARFREYGLQLASPGAPGIAGAAAIAPAGGSAAQLQNSPITLQTLTGAGASNVVVANIPALTLRLMKSDTRTRTLAELHLRAVEGATAQARFGDRVPVPVATFAPIALGGVAQQPITSYNYENVGVNLDITPRTHHDDEVTLALAIEVGNLETTPGYGGLPQFANRNVATTIRLKDGETSVMAGLVRDDETRLAEGIPGLTDVPGLGRLFGHTRSDSEHRDVVLTLTPHIVRSLQLTEADVLGFKATERVVPQPAEAQAPVAGGEPRSGANLTGTWIGDLPVVPGSPQMTWTLKQSGRTVAGHLTVALPGGFTLMDGTIAGSLTDSTFAFTVSVAAGAIPAAPTCSGEISGTADVTPTSLSGTASLATASCLPPITTMGFVLTRQ